MSSGNLQQQLATGAIVLFDLDALEPTGARVKLRFTGADRVRYLNGQVSNDMRRLQTAPGSSALAACVMNAKGKMNAYCWIHATEEALYLDADSGVDEEFREALAMRLERYIIADDVELADVTDDFSILHLVAADSEKLEALMNTEALQWRKSKRFACDGGDIIVPATEKAQVIEQLAAVANIVTVGAKEVKEAEVFRVVQGVPRWGYELDENTLPAEAGLDASAIDFHKGCYIGQEIISRIKSVGRVNRQLRHFSSTEPLENGMTLINSEGQTVGRLTSAVRLEETGRTLALGYLKRGNEGNTTFLAISGEEAGEGKSIPVELLPNSSIS